MKKTRLGTSDVPGDICTNGLALFPAIGSLRAGISAGERPVHLITANPSVVVASLEFSITNTVSTGVCGPAYGIRFDLEGQADPGKGSFTVLDDTAAAGFFVGHAIEPKITLNFWAFGKNVVKANIGQRIDLIALLIEIIKQLLAKTTKKAEVKKGETVTHKGVKVGFWGMYDVRRQELSSGGKVTVTPSYDIPIDIVPKLGWMGAIMKQLRRIGSTLEFGPGLSVMVPVTIKVTDVQYNGVRYASLSFASGQFHGTAQPPVQRSDAVSTRLSHEPGFDLGIFLFVSLKVGKWFQVGTQTPKLKLLQFMNIEQYVRAGPYYACLGNAEGAVTVGRAEACTAHLTDLEVVLDPDSLAA